MHNMIMKLCILFESCVGELVQLGKAERHYGMENFHELLGSLVSFPGGEGKPPLCLGTRLIGSLAIYQYSGIT